MPLVTLNCTYSLQWANPPALDPHEQGIPDMRHFLQCLTSGDFVLWASELKIDTPVSPVPGNVHGNFVFSPRVSVLELGANIGNRQTDGRTGKSCNAAY